MGFLKFTDNSGKVVFDTRGKQFSCYDKETREHEPFHVQTDEAEDIPDFFNLKEESEYKDFS